MWYPSEVLDYKKKFEREAEWNKLCHAKLEKLAKEIERLESETGIAEIKKNFELEKGNLHAQFDTAWKMKKEYYEKSAKLDNLEAENIQLKSLNEALRKVIHEQQNELLGLIRKEEVSNSYPKKEE